MKKAKITAVCGMMAALSVVLMFITTFVTVFVYVLPIATGLIVFFVSEFADKKWAMGVFFTTAFLSLVLLTDKEAGLTYTLFFGYYPLLKHSLEKLPKVLAWFVKLVIFNIAAVCIGVLGVLVFGISAEEYKEFGVFTIPLLLGLANIAFILYDIAFSRNAPLLKHLAQKTQKSVLKR